jgi:hypothetical protein
MESIQNSGSFKPINEHLHDWYKADVILSIQNNKFNILKNRYGELYEGPKTIIDIFSRSLMCNVGLFEEGFKNDLIDAIDKVFETYNLNLI